MFQAGELVVYNNMGVCRVADVSVPDFCKAGEARMYYTLEPQSKQGTIFVPVDAKVYMRPVMTGEEAEKLIDGIPSIQAEAYHSHALQELNQHYAEAISTHDCADLIELVMSIYAKKRHREKQNQKMGTVDENYMRRAEALLYGELSVALSIEEKAVPAYIAARVKAMGKESAAPHAKETGKAEA